MPGWFRRLFGAVPPAPLRGAPAVRRMKNHTALSGYVYEYVYDGMRETAALETEYVFTFSADRKRWFTLSVRVAEAEVRAWETAHARELGPAERYAVAKLALLAAFDEHPSPAALRSPLSISAARIGELLGALGYD
jgi:hypothetical protein